MTFYVVVFKTLPNDNRSQRDFSYSVLEMSKNPHDCKRTDHHHSTNTEIFSGPGSHCGAGLRTESRQAERSEARFNANLI